MGWSMRGEPCSVDELTDEEIEAQMDAEAQAMEERVRAGHTLCGGN